MGSGCISPVKCRPFEVRYSKGELPVSCWSELDRVRLAAGVLGPPRNDLRILDLCFSGDWVQTVWISVAWCLVQHSSIASSERIKSHELDLRRSVCDLDELKVPHVGRQRRVVAGIVPDLFVLTMIETNQDDAIRRLESARNARLHVGHERIPVRVAILAWQILPGRQIVRTQFDGDAICRRCTRLGEASLGFVVRPGRTASSVHGAVLTLAVVREIAQRITCAVATPARDAVTDVVVPRFRVCCSRHAG